MTIEATDLTPFGTYNYLLRVYGFNLSGITLTVGNFVDIPLTFTVIETVSLAATLTTFASALKQSYISYSLLQNAITIQLPAIIT